jgi:hypothetical protein
MQITCVSFFNFLNTAFLGSPQAFCSSLHIFGHCVGNLASYLPHYDNILKSFAIFIGNIEHNCAKGTLNERFVF